MATNVQTDTRQPSSPTGGRHLPTACPPLENGDRLTRAEFERRYDAMPELRKAELIEGVVYLTSPVHVDQHGEPHADEDGITRSRVFPGLWLDTRALLRGDL